MKRNLLKKCILFLLCGCLCLQLCGCSLTDTSIDELMRPPQLSESRQQVQQALQTVLGTSYQLIAPSGGDYRSNINLQDLDGDGQNEAICFFTAGGIQLLDVLVLQKKESEWVQWGRFSSDATNVERLDFADLNGDGTKELVIGWSYLTGSEKLMEILQLDKERLSSRYKEKYSRFATLGEQVVVIDQSAAAATLLGFLDRKLTSLSSVPIDSRITAFAAITVGKTTAGNPAVYLDAQLEDRTYHTEVLVINGEKYLENKLLTEEALRCDRPWGIRCTDIDGDGVPEIPRTEPMGNGDSAAYYTHWSDFDGSKLSEPLITYTSVSDQFYLEYPAHWQGKVFVRQDSKMQRLYHFINRKGEILYSLRAFTVTEYSQISASDGWIALIESTDKVIAYKTGAVAADQFAFTTAQWAAALHTYNDIGVSKRK